MNEDKQFEKLARKVKFRRWLITLATVVITVPIMLLLMYRGTQYLSGIQSQQLNQKMEIAETVMAPNIQLSDQVLDNTSVWGGNVVSRRYKVIDGYHVPWSAVQGKYSWFNDTLADSVNLNDYEPNAVYDRITQVKEPIFYNNRLRHSEVKRVNELPDVAKMRNYVAEVAVTFKKPLTYQQIQSKLPKTIHADWYWIGVGGKLDPTMDGSNFLGIQADGGRLMNQDYRYFHKALQKVTSENVGLDSNGAIAKYAHQYARQNPSLKKAVFYGVILTGRSEQFSRIKNQTWYVESSAGATVKRVPYIKPQY